MKNKYSDRNKAIKIITESANNYKENLLNKNILFIFKSSNCMQCFMATFKSENFLHFTGVHTKMKADIFFNKAVNKKLTTSDFYYKNDYLTALKLEVLNDAVYIDKNARSVGIFNKQGIKIEADIASGNNSHSVTFKILDNIKIVPISVLNTDVRDITNPTSPIVAILSKGIKDKQFDIVTYKSKNINIDKLHFPADIKEMLTENALYQLKPSLREDKSTEIAAADENEYDG